MSTIHRLRAVFSTVAIAAGHRNGEGRPRHLQLGWRFRPLWRGLLFAGFLFLQIGFDFRQWQMRQQLLKLLREAALTARKVGGYNPGGKEDCAMTIEDLDRLPTIHYTQIAEPLPNDPNYQELQTFRRELPRL